MKIADLQKTFGIDPPLIDLWIKEYGASLLPVQARAVTEGRLFEGGNLLVFAPTTSGKTFVGELLATTAARKGKRVLYLVPTKALAEEKAAHFTRLYQPAGITTVLSSRDHREWDDAIRSMSFHIAVLVYEKLSALLVGWPQLLEEIGVVVLDELQMLSDEERGGMIEILLTKIKTAPSRPRLLGLSAVLAEGEALAKWLNADLLVETRRPVPLRKGIFCNGTFFYREHNTGQIGEERWIDLPPLKKESDLLIALARYLGESRGEPTLLFLKDKSSVEFAAGAIADRVSLPPAEEAIEALASMEETASRAFLLNLLKKGVALHHADLPWELRDLVERAFRSGAIRILCATSTLAMGINCPAKNVLIESRQWHYYRRYGKMATRDLPRALYENMAGRGGRWGYIDDFGRAILVTHSPFQRRVWTDAYIDSPLEKITGALVSEDLTEYLLNLIASGKGASIDDLLSFLQETFSAGSWKQRNHDAQRAKIEAILSQAVEQGVVVRDEKGRYRTTEIGTITALKGIRLQTALSLIAWMRKSDPQRLSEIECLYALARTKDAKAIAIPLSREEIRRKNYRALLQKEIFSQQEEQKPIFKTLAEPMKTSAYEEAAAIKKTLLLSEWVTAKATSEMELFYHLHAGAIKRVGEEFSWLVEAAAAIAKAVGWPEEGAAQLQGLSNRLINGLPVTGRSLFKLPLRAGRSALLKLLRAGYDTPEALFELSLEEMKRILPSPLSERLHPLLHSKTDAEWSPCPPDRESAREEDADYLLPGTTPNAARSEFAGPALSHASGGADQKNPSASFRLLIHLRRDEVFYKGIPVHFPPLTLRLLVALAEKPGEIATKQTLYEHLWGEIRNPDDFPYEAQLRDHKRRVLQCIRKAVGDRITDEEIQGLIRTKARRGYLLALPPEAVRIIR
ncbi:MAG: DEAD/DEAH box helicase [Nitrospirae bacterium]|nr:DEAD/DEAH box helicase [Candidatus Manganitrophaceae bacterium]